MKPLPETDPRTWRYRILKGYLKLMHETLLVRHRYTIGWENLPTKDEKFFIVCNHQNTANDPLNIVFTFPRSWHICALARANVFSVNPLVTRFLNWIGLMPAFRLGWEGGEGLDQNLDSFDIVAKRINHPYPVIVFPEAGHTQGHYLDRFTTGTTRMAFHAAKANGWKDDIKIVPTAHHYSDYFDIHTDFVWMIGKPISLKPYYETYQEHPNSVMRDITRQLRHTIQTMMLDEGKEDYDIKDFLRSSALNPATLKGLPLPERLESDKAFIKQLLENPDYQEIINLTTRLKNNEEQLGITDLTVAEKPGWMTFILRVALLLCLLPLWVIALWPHAICYSFPPHLIKSDKMFTNSYRFIMSVLFLYPIFAVMTIAVMGLAVGWWWQAILWVLLWIPTARFCWWYYRILRNTRQAYHFLIARLSIKKIEALREEIRKKLQNNI